MVQVTFDVREPGTHLVRMTQVVPAGEPVRTFRMAAWVPGSYKIRDFGRHVQDFWAEVDGKKVKSEQTGKDAWTAWTQGKEVTLHFDVYARDLTVDTSHVTNDHAHLFPATLVLYDEATRNTPHRVNVLKPRGWKLFTGLETAALDGTLEDAQDYDHLIDCPFEVVPAERVLVDTFTVRRKKHRLVYFNAPEFDRARISKDVKAVVEATANLFGGLPYQHYTFISHVATSHGGGLEHRNSTVLGVDPSQLQVEKKIKTRFLPLVAHEFFHTWNVKRILPEKFTPYDLQREVYTDLLWLFEGFTSYFELPLLQRAGVVDDDAWGEFVAEMLKYYEMAIGRQRRSVSESSRLTWSLLYQPHEHNVNRNVSYYTKGLFVGLCLDHHLRMNGSKLDAVMQYLWANHDTSKGQPGVPEDGFANIVKAATGVDVAGKLRAWTHGTSELPIDKAFRDLGFDVKREHADDKKPNGLGVTFKPKTRIIERIPDDVPCYGILQPDDELVAVEDYKWDGAWFAELAALRQPGDKMRISAFREGRLRHFEVPLTEMPKSKISIKVRKDAAATRRRKAWFT